MNDKHEKVVLPRKVAVRFLVAGVGPIEEIYDLGYAEHMLVWSLNERLTAAVQIGVRVVEEVAVTRSVYRQIIRSRKGMEPYIRCGVNAARDRAQRAAAEQKRAVR